MASTVHECPLLTYATLRKLDLLGSNRTFAAQSTKDGFGEGFSMRARVQGFGAD